MVDTELGALIEQAGRNLKKLELLSQTWDLPGGDQTRVASYRKRLQDLQDAYRLETDALTHIVLQQSVERRWAA